jgi:hypothetical protein
MELADSSFISLEEAKQKYGDDSPVIKKCCLFAIAHLFVIFLKTEGIVNADLHSGNILVKIDKNENIEAVKIIDFGRTVRIKSMDDWFSGEIKKKYKRRMIAIKKAFGVQKNDFRGINLHYESGSGDDWFDKLIKQMVVLETKPEQKLPSNNFLFDLNISQSDEIVKRVCLLLHVLSELDFAYNNSNNDSLHYQMEFLLKIVFGSGVISEEYVETYVNWYNDELMSQTDALEIWKLFMQLVTPPKDEGQNPYSVVEINKAVENGLFPGYDKSIFDDDSSKKRKADQLSS